MKKADLQELTRLGVRRKLEQIERYLGDMFTDFPDEFATKTPPVFMRPIEKAGGNSWPVFAASVAGDAESNGAEETAVSGHKTSWTPERKAAQALRMKKAQRHGGYNGKGIKWGTFQFQRIHDYLLTRPQHAASISEMEKALNIVGSSVLSAIGQHKNLFRKTGVRGTYQLKKVVPASKRQSSNGPAKKATAHHKRKAAHSGARTLPKNWGDSVWHRLHDYLHDQQDMTAPLTSIMRDNKINSHASAITAMQSHADMFERTNPGVYRLTRVLTDDEKKQYLKQP